MSLHPKIPADGQVLPFSFEISLSVGEGTVSRSSVRQPPTHPVRICQSYQGESPALRRSQRTACPARARSVAAASPQPECYLSVSP